MIARSCFTTGKPFERMARVSYVNGRYQPYRAAQVHVEDRGYQFGDAVYEVCEINNRKLVDLTRHLARLDRSLKGLQITRPMSDRALRHVMREVVRRNRVKDGLLYMQVSRGVARRDFPFPTPTPKPTLVVIARASSPQRIAERAAAGISVITQPDPRWQRCDIKTVMLLPAVLAKQGALEQGADDVWFVDRDGFITEGASANAWMITQSNKLVTRPLSPAILPGVTRATALDAISKLGLQLEERRFTVEEATEAAEAFQTSASGTIMPVVGLNAKAIGSGQPGPLTLKLRRMFHDFAELG